MIEALETLAALSEWGTMTRAATHLRLTQSAVSKRIRGLELHLGAALVEPHGRCVVLTPAGSRLLAKVSPSLATLRDALAIEGDEGQTVLNLGVSESILASWGGAVLEMACAATPDIELSLNSHRSPIVTERVLAGEYSMGLVAGSRERAAGLIVDELTPEPFCIVPKGLRPFRLRRGSQVEVCSIEAVSATGRVLRRRLPAFRSESGIDLTIQSTLQSFGSIVGVARAGLVSGLVPETLALAMGVPESVCMRLPKPGLERPVCLVVRRTAIQRPAVALFRQNLREAAQGR